MAYRNAHGELIYVDIRKRQYPSLQRAVEVCVSSGRIQLLPWIAYTGMLALLAFIIQLHTLHLGWLCIAVLLQLGTLLYRIHGKIVSETLLVVAGLGVQTTATFYLGKRHTRFIPWGNIIDIVIAETITMQRVLFYMALLVKEQSPNSGQKLIPLFLNTWPRLACLQQIYTACQDVLSPKCKTK